MRSGVQKDAVFRNVTQKVKTTSGSIWFKQVLLSCPSLWIYIYIYKQTLVSNTFQGVCVFVDMSGTQKA